MGDLIQQNDWLQQPWGTPLPFSQAGFLLSSGGTELHGNQTSLPGATHLQKLPEGTHLRQQSATLPVTGDGHTTEHTGSFCSSV